jgi:alpha,alpha-trehalase
MAAKPAVVIDTRYHDGVVFDTDGVVTDTASIHARAWAMMFDDFLSTRPAQDGENHSTFMQEDYLRFVDGKPRYNGVADFLASRGVSLDAAMVRELGDRKQEIFLRLLADGVPRFESTVELVRQLQSAGIGTGLYSASRNCQRVLEGAGIEHLFGVRVDGNVAAELGLPGKPDPAMLIETARRLRVRPERCVVVEDAEAGVAAGRNGGFGFVIGVDRTGHADALRECGADAVVSDLAEVTVRPDEDEHR